MARGKGKGTLIKRGGLWQCKVVVDGVPHYKATGTSSKVEARRILEEFARPFEASSEVERLERLESRIRAAEEGAADSESDYSNARLDLLLDRYYATANAREVSDGTRREYEAFVSQLVKWAKANAPAVKTVKDVSKAVVESYLEWLKPRVSAGYYNCSLALFRKIWKEFRRLSKARCFADNPWEGYRYKTADVSTRRALTPDEIKSLFDACETPDERTLFYIGLYTGLRVGDCATLRWSEVDFERRLIVRRPIKTKRHGVVVTLPVHPVLYAELERRRRAVGADSEYVLPEDAKHYLAMRKCSAAVRVFERAGIEGASFHSLRHTFVSAAASAGVPLDVVRKLVGHASVKMTDHYSHLSDEAMQKAVASVPAVGQAARRKALVEIDTGLLKELESLGLGVEEALRELVKSRRNTVTVAA